MSKRKIQMRKRADYGDELAAKQADEEAMRLLCEHSWEEANKPRVLPFRVSRISDDYFEVDAS